MGGLGFRNMDEFNMALLAKQDWRIIKNPDSLASRVLKGKYFPSNIFLTARLGTSPSYLWRSILEAKELLVCGLRWRIGNGVSVKVWHDPWVPKPYSFKVLPIKKELWPEAKVCDLIDFETGSWRKQLLETLFLKHEVEEICKIPLSPCWPQDELIWHYTKDGEFSVRSAYHLAVELKGLEEGVSSSSEAAKEKSFWSQLWQLNVPPKVKIFLWKASNGILATGHNLQRRVKAFNKGCQRCGCSTETDKHIIFDCLEAKQVKQVWKEAGMDPRSKKHSSFKDWLQALMEDIDKQHVEYTVIISWLIWKSRNESIFEGVAKQAKQICIYGQNLLKDYQTCQAKREVSNFYQDNGMADNNNWKSPPNGFLKMNIDGAFSSIGAGVGAVIRNSEGEVEAVMAANIPQYSSAEHAETMAVLKALQLAEEHGITHLIIEGDALNVINSLKNEQKDLSRLGHFVEGIRELAKSFPTLKFQYVKRSLNKPAHEAAKIGVLLQGSYIWYSDFPKSVLQAVNFENDQ